MLCARGDVVVAGKAAIAMPNWFGGPSRPLSNDRVSKLVMGTASDD